MTDLYLLQASSLVRITRIRDQIETYNLKNKEEGRMEVLPGLYLGLYYQLLVTGEINTELLKQARRLNYFFNNNTKNQTYSLQKLTEKEKEKVLSGVITKIKDSWKNGDRVFFPLGEGEGEGTILEVLDSDWIIVGFSIGSKNKIKVESSKCRKR